MMPIICISGGHLSHQVRLSNSFFKKIMTQRLGLPNHEIQTMWAELLWGKMQKTIPDYAHNDLPGIKDFLKQNKRPLHLAKNYSMLHLAKRNSGESSPKDVAKMVLSGTLHVM